MNSSFIDVVGLCGSLRAASINRMALGLAGQEMPAGMALEQLEWEGLPPFSADRLADAMPPSVITLSERIRRADAVVTVTPEYNFSIPGSWGRRCWRFRSCFDGTLGIRTPLIACGRRP
jgi:chromate reductase